ncbi:MAG TPA: heptaprenyl diphosphate synthase component 1 [Bacilli bacterium]
MDNFRIAEMARKYTEYDMIQAFTKLPDYPDAKTRLLMLFLNGGKAASHMNEIFALVASLVQMGLDTHELIANREEAMAKHEPFRSIQLKVLAGDYFSSRFYQLLAQAGRIDLIGQISTAICEVNQLKMRFYEKTKAFAISAEEYLQTKVRINTEIYLSLGSIMEGAYRKHWPEVLRGLASCELLAEEIAVAKDGERFSGSLGFWHLLDEVPENVHNKICSGELIGASISNLIAEYQVPTALQRRLELQIAQLYECCGKINVVNVHAELERLLRPFHEIAV